MAEANNAVECLSRMYFRYVAIICEEEVEIVYSEEGEETGLKMVILKIENENVCNRLKEESGLVLFTSLSISASKPGLFRSAIFIDWFEDDDDTAIFTSKLEIKDNRNSLNLQRRNFIASYDSVRAYGQTEKAALENLRLKLNAYHLINGIRAYRSHQRRIYYQGPFNFIDDLQFNTYTTKADEVLDGNIDLLKEDKYKVR
jgi:protein subunit release factor B